MIRKLYWIISGILISCFCVACNSGTNSTVSNPEIRQNKVTISNSPVFPYDPSYPNKYSLVISNHENYSLELKDAQIMSSSLSIPNLSEIINTDSCNVLAPKSQCTLGLTLPAGKENGYLNFKLSYIDSKSGKAYSLVKLVAFEKSLPEESGLIYSTKYMEQLIENTTNFTVAIPFIREDNYNDLQILLAGQKPSGYNEIRCDETVHAGRLNCTALVEIQQKEGNPKLSLRATNQQGSIVRISPVDFNIIFNDMARLVYLNAPLVIKTNDTAEKTVTIVNIGTAPAKNFSVLPVNSSIIDLNLTSACKDLLASGDSCDLKYNHNNSNTLMGEHVQTIKFTNGINEDAPQLDTFRVYRSSANLTFPEVKNFSHQNQGSSISRPLIQVEFTQAVDFSKISSEAFFLSKNVSCDNKSKIASTINYIGYDTITTRPISYLAVGDYYLCMINSKIGNSAGVLDNDSSGVSIRKFTVKNSGSSYLYVIRRPPIAGIYTDDRYGFEFTPVVGFTSAALMRCVIPTNEGKKIPVDCTGDIKVEGMTSAEFASYLSDKGGALKLKVYKDNLYIATFSQILHFKIDDFGNLRKASTKFIYKLRGEGPITSLSFSANKIYITNYITGSAGEAYLYVCDVLLNGSLNNNCESSPNTYRSIVANYAQVITKDNKDYLYILRTMRGNELLNICELPLVGNINGCMQYDMSKLLDPTIKSINVSDFFQATLKQYWGFNSAGGIGVGHLWRELLPTIIQRGDKLYIGNSARYLICQVGKDGKLVQAWANDGRVATAPNLCLLPNYSSPGLPTILSGLVLANVADNIYAADFTKPGTLHILDLDDSGFPFKLANQANEDVYMHVFEFIKVSGNDGKRISSMDSYTPGLDAPVEISRDSPESYSALGFGEKVPFKVKYQISPGSRFDDLYPELSGQTSSDITIVADTCSTAYLSKRAVSCEVTVSMKVPDNSTTGESYSYNFDLSLRSREKGILVSSHFKRDNVQLLPIYKDSISFNYKAIVKDIGKSEDSGKTNQSNFINLAEVNNASILGLASHGAYISDTPLYYDYNVVAGDYTPGAINTGCRVLFSGNTNDWSDICDIIHIKYPEQKSIRLVVYRPTACTYTHPLNYAVGCSRGMNYTSLWLRILTPQPDNLLTQGSTATVKLRLVYHNYTAHEKAEAPRFIREITINASNN